MWWDERAVLRMQGRCAAASATRPLFHVDLDCPFLRAVVLQALARRPGWAVQEAGPAAAAEESSCPAEACCSWAEYERIDWARVLGGNLHTTAYCVRKGLIRKSQFAYHTRKWAAKHPQGCLAGGVPETLLFEMWDSEYLDEALADAFEVRDMVDGVDWWILKPSMTNQARGILVFNRLEQLKAALLEDGAEDVREWVLQRYIHRPLLVQGRKFHLRMYALAVGALSVYVFTDVLTLFSMEAYSDDPTALASHLTNTCRQAPLDAEQEAACVGLLSALPARLAAQGTASVGEASARCERVFADCAALVGECFAAVSSELSFLALPNALELFGMDLLVDQDWRVWLLEANAEPDFVQTGEALRGVVDGVVEGAFQLAVDRWFPQAQPPTGYGAAAARFVKVFERQDPRAHGRMSFQ